MKINFKEKLKRDLLNGEQQAFIETVALCNDLVYASAFKILKNCDDAEDVVQDVFTLLYSKRNHIKFDTNIPIWLYTSAVFISKRLLGRQQTVRKYQAKVHTVAVDDHEDEKEIVLDELNNLPDSHREVLFQHFILGYKSSEIASSKGLKLTTVCMRIQRGLAVLKGNLSKKGYVVSALGISAILLNADYLSANSSVSVDTIVAQSIYGSHEVFHSVVDSDRMRQFDNSQSILNRKISFLISVIVFTVCVTYLFADGLHDGFQDIVWNDANGNLSELNLMTKENIIINDSISNQNILAYSGEKMIDIPLPGLLPDVPVKISCNALKKKEGIFFIGLHLADEKQILSYDIHKIGDFYESTHYDTVVYLLGNTRIFVLNGTPLSIAEYQVKLNRHRVVLRFKNFKTKEIRLEAMSEEEISFCENILAENIKKKNSLSHRLDCTGATITLK